MTDEDTLADVERWFRLWGIPHLIGDHSASRDVFGELRQAFAVRAVYLAARAGRDG